ncbi:MAG: hypothetical protein M1814_001442 [Vezdaea aestivalis]|nr:MAG: hypothetical protein M1814_001442 [Vezdaea aestivalis]
MHMQTAAIVALISLLPTLSLAALNGPCTANGVPGTCISTESCGASGGKSATGFCPNDPTNVKCCTKESCGNGGNCRFTSNCQGTSLQGLCPGPNAFQCCVPTQTGGGGSTGGSVGDHQLSDKGAEFIAGFEGFRADFYNDAAGVKTIGYGHACQPSSSCDSINAPITQAQGEQLLKADAARFVSCVNSLVKVALNQNQFDALVSFGYNLGCGNVAEIAADLNNNAFSTATENMKKYNRAGGVVLQGLVRRRQAEVDLFNS